MFALACWDRSTRTLTLARDIIGEKPLYYGWQGYHTQKTLLFASELKSLTVHPSFYGEVDRKSIALSMRHNCIPAPHTIYEGIYKLEPGSYIEFTEHDFSHKEVPKSCKYWSTPT